MRHPRAGEPPSSAGPHWTRASALVFGGCCAVELIRLQVISANSIETNIDTGDATFALIFWVTVVVGMFAALVCLGAGVEQVLSRRRDRHVVGWWALVVIGGALVLLGS